LWQLTFVFLEDSAIEAGMDLSELEEPLPQLMFTSVDEEVKLNSSGEAFVDDSNLASPSSMSSNPHEVSAADQRVHTASAVENLQVLALRWERALFSTGGAINFSKSFWFVFHWNWKGGIPYLENPPQSAQLRLTEGSNLNRPVNVPQKSVHDTYRTLGAHISPSGDNRESYKVLLAKAQDYQTKIASSKLPREAALLSYNIYLLSKLGYPLPALTFTEAQCHTLQSPTLLAFLPKIQLNRHIARSIVFGSIKYGGLGLKSLYSIQSIGQLTLFVGHTRAQDKTSSLLHISLSYLQLAVGSSVNVCLLYPSTYKHWIDSCWLVSFWDFLYRVQLTITTTKHWLPKLTCKDDKVLMDHFIALGYPASTLGVLNHCRLYLQIIMLSDIVSADGTCIIQDIFYGLQLIDRHSTLKWLQQQRPPNKDWEVWCSALRILQPRNKLEHPLGPWTTHESHQSWHWFKSSNSLTYSHCDSMDTWTSYKGYPKPRRATRLSALTVLGTESRTPIARPPVNLLPASANFTRCTNLTTITPGPAKPQPIRYQNYTPKVGKQYNKVLLISETDQGKTLNL
jgi:hypothetical protein